MLFRKHDRKSIRNQKINMPYYTQYIFLSTLLLCAPSIYAATTILCTNLAPPGCTCSVTATSIQYGSVPVDQISSHRDADGQITLSCSASGQTLITQIGAVILNISYTISLGPSSNRQLQSGSYSIPYKIYQDSTHSIEWGTSGESKAYTGLLSLSASANLTGLLSLNFSIGNKTILPYARLFPNGGALKSGLYSDTVSVSVSY
jgi:spore coat protein U-like protein